MIIVDENSTPITIENILTPLGIEYFWVLNLEDRDFKLKKLEVLEEHTTPLLVLKIKEFSLEIPANWNILIMSTDTYQLDIAQASELCRGDFFAFLLDHKNHKPAHSLISVVHYFPMGLCQIPSLNKNEMLCISIGENYWACISPTDNYNKYIKNCSVGDIL